MKHFTCQGYIYIYIYIYIYAYIYIYDNRRFIGLHDHLLPHVLGCSQCVNVNTKIYIAFLLHHFWYKYFRCISTYIYSNSSIHGWIPVNSNTLYWQ